MTATEAPKAIETRAFGYRFRSRLEARWATFFTELDLTWHYEPQGFDLPAAGPYLPDFWIETWLFAGDCWAAKHAIYQFHDRRSGMFNLLAECPSCRCMAAMLVLEDSQALSKFGDCRCKSTPMFADRGSRLLDAYTAARSARFEYGESK